jgi:hypothetical protein
MTNENSAVLQLTYEQFVAVLRQWDDYTHVEFNEMARNFPVYIGGSDSWSWFSLGGRITPGYAVTKPANLSDLAELLWKTLQAGPMEVDRIHDETYVSNQVEHFKETYASPEHVASLMRDEDGGRETLEQPTDMFFKLGKPAQIIITREGLLEEAIEIYKQGEEIVNNKDQAEINERARQRQQEKVVTETRKRVRELDKLQCVYCGAPVNNNFRYTQISPGDYLPENIVFSCAPCNTKIKHNAPEVAEMTPKFGRFSEPESQVYG